MTAARPRLEQNRRTSRQGTLASSTALPRRSRFCPAVPSLFGGDSDRVFRARGFARSVICRIRTAVDQAMSELFTLAVRDRTDKMPFRRLGSPWRRVNNFDGLGCVRAFRIVHARIAMPNLRMHLFW